MYMYLYEYKMDKASFNIPMNEDSMAELKEIFNNKKYFIEPNGSMPFTPVTIVNTIVANMFTE